MKRHSIDALPFVGRRKDPGKTDFPRCFWTVRNTRDYAADWARGEQYALQWLTYERSKEVGGTPPTLGWIVSDMPSKLGGCELGFLQMVAVTAVDAAAVSESSTAPPAQRKRGRE